MLESRTRLLNPTQGLRVATSLMQSVYDVQVWAFRIRCVGVTIDVEFVSRDCILGSFQTQIAGCQIAQCIASAWCLSILIGDPLKQLDCLDVFPFQVKSASELIGCVGYCAALRIAVKNLLVVNASAGEVAIELV